MCICILWPQQQILWAGICVKDCLAVVLEAAHCIFTELTIGAKVSFPSFIVCISCISAALVTVLYSLFMLPNPTNKTFKTFNECLCYAMGKDYNPMISGEEKNIFFNLLLKIPPFHLTLFFLIKHFFIVVQLQLSTFSPHPSTPPQPNPPPSPASTLPLDFVHVK